MIPRDTTPEMILEHATELSVSQQRRLQVWFTEKGQTRVYEFFAQPEELQATARISELMGYYGALRGLVKMNDLPDMKGRRI